MKLINATLNDKQIKSSELPEAITNQIKELKDLIVKYNDSVNEYNNSSKQTKAGKQKLDAMSDHIEEFENKVVQEIKAYEKPEPIVESTPAPAPDPTPDPAPIVTEKKEDSGLGWLIFGGVALVVTLGAVNLFKKRA
jgi:hypothetical protein